MQFEGKTIVVTGAGSGVGRQLTLRLLDKGADVAAVDISEISLFETYKASGEDESLSSHVIDIADYDAVSELAEDVVKIHGNVDAVINNAGIIQPFIKVNDLDMEQIEKVMNVNFYGTVNMIKVFLPKLLDRPRAYIVNVSSMGGFLPVPGQVAYGASKSAVKLLSEGLYSELKDTSVGVSLILPGGINTDIAKNSNVKMKTAQESSKMSKLMLTPERAAELIIKAMERNTFRKVIGKDAKLFYALYKCLPKAAMSIIASALGK